MIAVVNGRSLAHRVMRKDATERPATTQLQNLLVSGVGD